MTVLLARSAECLFWLARYMERCENLARLLDVTETFTQDPDDRNWLALVEINADGARFFKRHDRAREATVLDFYLLDLENPTSIASSLRAARENARALRPLISIEMWHHLNTLNHRVATLTPHDIETPRLSRLCSEIKQGCQAHFGITEGTLYRDQAWYFYNLGKFLERADQTTRLLDIKYHLLLPHLSDIGTPLDASQWITLLRAVAGYQAFRRVFPGRIQPPDVAGFLLFSDSFPRAVSLCIRQLDWHLNQLRSRFGVRGGDDALLHLDGLRAVFSERSIEDIIHEGLHEFIDWVQSSLNETTKAIGNSYF